MKHGSKHHVARTAKAATKLGHAKTSQTMADLDEQTKADGVVFSDVDATKDSICFLGPCDAATGTRWVSYRDKDGNCSDLRQVPC